MNFAAFSAHAHAISVCLFDASGRETDRLPLPEREGDIWFGHIDGLSEGALYGLRAEGPFHPEAGHRFNSQKLLLDPYAKALSGTLTWHPALIGHAPNDPTAPDPRDSAPFMPRARVTAPLPPRSTPPLRRPWSEIILYEAHLKGLTMEFPGVADPGTFQALASPPVLDHLTALGITAIELLPVHAFITDAFLQKKKLTNYWGYQTLSYFAPHPAYLSTGALDEVRAAVETLQGAGIEVILDVVYNHTCEGDAHGPTLSFRGLDNASYYRLDAHGGYVNHTGTGNTLNTSHPGVLRLMMDSLRHWVEGFGIDGCRYDLGATLGRHPEAFDPHAPLFQAIAQDPVLAQCKHIAEPWDIGPGGYQLGNFPAPFTEWNDRFRDTARRIWRGDIHAMPEMAARLTGSADLFDHSGRPATTSINFITAHDGFTLADLTMFREKRNMANGEEGRDGHGENLSDNLGEEGPSPDPEIRAARALRRRNLLATLLFSQGTPMLLAGDEIGNSQSGNNNAYAMDNPTGWVNWTATDPDLLAFARRLIALRQAHPALGQTGFLHGAEEDGRPRDLIWRRPDGNEMTIEDWEVPALPFLIAEFRGQGTDRPAYLLAILTSDAEMSLTLPPGTWTQLIDTAAPDADPASANGAVRLTGPSVRLFCQDDRSTQDPI